jgi:hypothetical protein
VSKLTMFLCVSSWILNNVARIVDVIKQLNLSRLEVDKNFSIPVAVF